MVNDMMEIRWHARGGQGCKTAVSLVASVALAEGKYSQGFPDYGPEREGAPIRGYTRISNAPVRIHSAIYNPNIVVVLDSSLLDALDVTDGLVEGGTVLINSSLEPQDVRKRIGNAAGEIWCVDASQISIEELGRPFPNMPMVGALAKVIPFISIQSVLASVEGKLHSKGDRIVQGNCKSIQRAFEEVKSG